MELKARIEERTKCRRVRLINGNEKDEKKNENKNKNDSKLVSSLEGVNMTENVVELKSIEK